jgi:hypothetical protein
METTMTKPLIRTAWTLIAAALLVTGWDPGTAAGQSRRRGADKAAASREAPADEGDRVDKAEEAAERAGVSRRDLSELKELCERGDFTAAQTVRILTLAAQLALEELPVESFAAKIGEGVSKGVEPAKIVQVAEKRALMLNRAKSILNGAILDGAPVRDREELIPDVAEALETGQTMEEIRRILKGSFEEGDSIGEIRRKIIP